MTEHAQCGAGPLTLSVDMIRGAERGCCLDLWVSDRENSVSTDSSKPAWLVRVTRFPWGFLFMGLDTGIIVIDPLTFSLDKQTDNLIHFNSIQSRSRGKINSLLVKW